MPAYEELAFQKMDRISEEYAKEDSVKRIVKEMKRLLTWWVTLALDGKGNLLERFYGWTIQAPEPENELDEIPQS